MEVTIPVFDGVEYESWKRRICMYLKMQKCDQVVMRAETNKNDDWQVLNVKAMNYIYSAISNRQLEFVKHEEDAFDIMKKFDEMYLKESTALQIIWRNKLEKMKLQDFADVPTFFNEFEKAINMLRAAGAMVSEKEKINYMLRTLPSSLSYIGDLVDILKEEDKTLEYVKSKISMMKLKEEEQTTNVSNIFLARKQERKCYNCGKRGHFQRDCWQPQESWKHYKQQQQQYSRGGLRDDSQRRDGKPDQNKQYGLASGCSNYQQRDGRGNYQQRDGRGNYQQRGGRGQHQQERRPGGYQHERRRGYQDDRYNSFSTEVQNVISNKVTLDSGNDFKVNWLLDSGCTDHVINNDKYFYDSMTLEEPIKVKIGDGNVLKATKIGDVICYFLVYGKRVKVRLPNVFYVKEMNRNLISFAKVTDKNKIISRGNTSKIYDKDNELIAVAWKEDRLYKMTSMIEHKRVSVNVANNVNNQKDSLTLKEKWHRILGHVNFSTLNTLCRKQLLEGIPEKLESEFMKCKICIENKMHNLPFDNNRSRAKEILEIVHSDLNGPHTTTGFNGDKYFLTFIDDYSKLAKVYPIKSKDQVYNCFVQYINEVENITGKTIKRLRCDNGKEYLNSNIYRLAREKGIFINVCPPYVHELNGTAERYNRSVMDMSRCLFAEAKVDRKFWPEVVCAAAYLRNRVLTNTIEKKTPYEIFFGKKPNTKYLRFTN